MIRSAKGTLLLEQASLATPARVEEMAIDKLKMTLPTSKNTYMLHAKVTIEIYLIPNVVRYYVSGELEVY